MDSFWLVFFFLSIPFLVASVLFQKTPCRVEQTSSSWRFVNNRSTIFHDEGCVDFRLFEPDLRKNGIQINIFLVSRKKEYAMNLVAMSWVNETKNMHACPCMHDCLIDWFRCLVGCRTHRSSRGYSCSPTKSWRKAKCRMSTKEGIRDAMSLANENKKMWHRD